MCFLFAKQIQFLFVFLIESYEVHDNASSMQTQCQMQSKSDEYLFQMRHADDVHPSCAFICANVRMLAFGFVGHVIPSSVKLRRVVEPGVPVVARNEGRVVPVPGP
jgi:hypothetical protein